MSIDDVDIRKSILKLVRKSASVDYNPESLQEPGNYSEYRTKFLECRKQFEHPPPPIQKVPFLPHWVKPEYDTYLPITYKKRGNLITDVRIKFFKNDAENCDKIGSQMEFDNPAYSIIDAETLTNEDLEVRNGNPQLLVSPAIQAASHSTDDNNYSSRTLEERVKRRMDRNNRHMRSIKRFQPLGITEERSSSMSSVNGSSSASNRIVDHTSMKNSSTLANDSATTYKQIVCRPIVRKAIELKKYDHIVTNVICSEK